MADHKIGECIISYAWIHKWNKDEYSTVHPIWKKKMEKTFKAFIVIKTDEMINKKNCSLNNKLLNLDINDKRND